MSSPRNKAEGGGRSRPVADWRAVTDGCVIFNSKKCANPGKVSCRPEPAPVAGIIGAQPADSG